jgi:Mrp family chromosome partitioning ATPase
VPYSSAPYTSLPYTSDMSNSSNALRHYVTVLRRRWRWVAAGVLLGMVGGLLSTFVGSKPASIGTFYKATNTIVTSDSSNINFEQVAFLLQSSEVQNRISADQNIPTQYVQGLLSARPKPEVSAIEVTAIATDADVAVNLADAGAKILIDSTSSESKAQYERELESINSKLSELRAERLDLEAQINRGVGDVDLLRAELDSIINQYRITYEQFQAVTATGSPATANFVVYQPATPIRINPKGFKARYDANINARGSSGALFSATATKSESVETDLNVTNAASRFSRTLIGGLVGLVLGLASAFIIEVWDDRIRRRDNVEMVTGIPVVAEIPQLTRSEREANSIAVLDAPRSRSAERFRTIRTSILFVLEAAGLATGDDDGPAVSRTPVILVTSPSPGEGKTTSTSNVSSIFAAGGSRTLVIDCDYRKPSIAKYLLPIPDLENPDLPQRTRVDNLFFIPAPKSAGAAPAETIAVLLGLIDRWRDEFDIVFLDTPPMLTTNDATDLLSAADHVLLVIRSGQTRTVAAERVAALLSRFSAPVLGTILNGCSVADMDAYYGYYYYYGASRGYYGEPTPVPPPVGMQNPMRQSGPAST